MENCVKPHHIQKLLEHMSVNWEGTIVLDGGESMAKVSVRKCGDGYLVSTTIKKPNGNYITTHKFVPKGR